MPLNAILIDDELDSLEALSFELKSYCPEVRVLEMCTSAKKGIEAIQEHKPELVFLDIEMPEMNGFDMLNAMDEIPFDIIFVTAYDQFAVRAFEFNAIDYLLKPVLKSKLVEAVEKVEQKKSHQFSKDDLKALLQNIRSQSSEGIKNIALPTADGFEFVDLDEINYMQAESNYTWVFLSNGQKYLLAKTLKDMEMLIHGNQFFRSHQSYLVNINQVRKYIRGQGGYLVLKDGTQIPVSRSNKESLMVLLKGG